MEWYDIVGTIGFPIFVACYLLHYGRKTLNNLTQSNENLKKAVNELLKYLKNNNGVSR